MISDKKPNTASWLPLPMQKMDKVVRKLQFEANRIVNESKPFGMTAWRDAYDATLAELVRDDERHAWLRREEFSDEFRRYRAAHLMHEAQWWHLWTYFEYFPEKYKPTEQWHVMEFYAEQDRLHE